MATPSQAQDAGANPRTTRDALLYDALGDLGRMLVALERIRDDIRALPPEIAAAVRETADCAASEIERFAAGQTALIERATFEDRARFLDAQKALHQAWKEEMQALIDAQNAALERVVVRTVALLRAQASAAPGSPRERPARSRKVRDALLAGVAMAAGMASTAAVVLAVRWYWFGQ